MGKPGIAPAGFPKSNIPQALTTFNRQCVYQRGSLQRSLKGAEIRK